MDNKLIIGLVIAAAAILALPALAAPNYAATVERVERDIVITGYQKMTVQAEKLHDAIVAYCASDAPTTDIKTPFHETMDAWQAVQHVRYGPIAGFDRHARVQFWPDKRGKTGKHLRKFLASGSEDDLAPQVFGSKSVAIQGLQTLERLIFAKGGLSRTAVAGQAMSSCSVATAITNNLHVIARDTLSERLSMPSTQDIKAAVRNHVADLITGLEIISRLKLSGPIGKDRARPKLAESWRSERSLKNIQINLQTLRAQYIALAEPSRANDPESKPIISQFNDVIGEISAMEDALAPTLAKDTGRDQLRSLVLSLQDLRELVIISLTGHLDINLGFNSLDGD